MFFIAKLEVVNIHVVTFKYTCNYFIRLNIGGIIAMRKDFFSTRSQGRCMVCCSLGQLPSASFLQIHQHSVAEFGADSGYPDTSEGKH